VGLLSPPLEPPGGEGLPQRGTGRGIF